MSVTALGVALATLGVAPACADGTTVTAAEVPAAHDCAGDPAPAEPAHHHDCTMLAASCAAAVLAHTTITAFAPSPSAHELPVAHDEARPGVAERGPAPPPPRA